MPGDPYFWIPLLHFFVGRWMLTSSSGAFTRAARPLDADVIRWCLHMRRKTAHPSSPLHEKDGTRYKCQCCVLRATAPPTEAAEAAMFGYVNAWWGKEMFNTGFVAIDNRSMERRP